MSILCVGQIVFDILARPIHDKIFEHDSILVDSITFSNGGDALNVAVSCRKLGNEVGFVGKIGNDDKGAFLQKKMVEEGLDTTGLKIDPHSSTSSVIVLIRDNGARNFLYEGGANNAFTIDDINLSLLDTYRAVYIGGTFMLPGFDGLGASLLLKEARTRGLITAMDVTYDASGQWMNIIEPSLKYVDYFMPSIGEARELTGKHDVESMAKELIRCGVSHVIIKMGKEGIYIKSDEISRIVPPYDVQVVDTTGAGDAFVAGFLTGLNKGMNISQSADVGQAAAAQCIQSIGSTTGMRNLTETLQFIKTYGEQTHVQR
jgi:sugar/nucleoside kinase (ribokinase family)